MIYVFLNFFSTYMNFLSFKFIILVHFNFFFFFIIKFYHFFNPPKKKKKIKCISNRLNKYFVKLHIQVTHIKIILDGKNNSGQIGIELYCFYIYLFPAHMQLSVFNKRHQLGSTHWSIALFSQNHNWHNYSLSHSSYSFSIFIRLKPILPFCF